MNPRLIRWLVRLYPRGWRERYGEELEKLLQSGGGGVRTWANVAWSALCEHFFPTQGFPMDKDGQSQFQTSIVRSFIVRAPWVVFGLAPLLLLGGAYFVACLILWSGWRFFLPGTDTPFVPIDGVAIVYFGFGRMLYYTAPVLVGWSVAFIAARQKFKAFWPGVGLVMIALIGGAAQVRAWRPASGAAGHVSMSLALNHSAGLVRASMILGITMLPYVVWRLQKHSRLSA